MRRYLVFAGLDGDLDALKRLEGVIGERRPDLLLFAGGVSCQGCVSTERRPDLTPRQAESYHRWFEWLGRTGLPAALIPGRFDVPLEDFLKAGMAAEVEYGGVHMVEGSLWEDGDTAVCGVGGALTERETAVYPQVKLSRVMAEYALRGLARSDRSVKILLLSSPPNGKLGGDAGCAIVGELIDSLHPHIAVVAGPSEARGVERVAHTWVVNPGRLRDGCAAWIDWKRPGDQRVELLDLELVASS